MSVQLIADYDRFYVFCRLCKFAIDYVDYEQLCRL